MRGNVSEIEEATLIYVAKHDYRIRISHCAIELGLTFPQVESALRSLNNRRLLNIIQRPSNSLSCTYLDYINCKAKIRVSDELCENPNHIVCCHFCPDIYHEDCSNSCDVQHQEDQEKMTSLSELRETVGKEIADKLGSMLGYVIFAIIILLLVMIWFLIVHTG